MRSIGFALLCGLLAAACGGGNSGDDSGDDAVVPDADPNNPPDADLSDFTELIGRDWTIPAGEEVYRCIGIRVPEDMLISVFRVGNATGEHHQVLSLANDPGGFGGTQLGETNCNVQTLNLQMLFASGVGTDDLVFPDGVAIRVEAGQFLHLNLHLFNTNPTDDLVGHSGIYIKTITEAELDQEAEMIFSGTMNISIPGETNTTPYKTSGGCTFTQDATIFSYWPHSHQYSTHHKVTFTPSGGSAMSIHDDAYDFNDQVNYPLDTPLVVHNGDRWVTECTFENHTGTAIGWGDSSTEEMCFTGIYRYPKQAFSLYDCVDDGPF